jgi:hypothetical protein
MKKLLNIAQFFIENLFKSKLKNICIDFELYFFKVEDFIAD